MPLNFSIDTPKELIFENIAEYLHRQDLKIAKYDNTRPWGGFFVLDESEAEKHCRRGPQTYAERPRRPDRALPCSARRRCAANRPRFRKCSSGKGSASGTPCRS